jgi:hypothetical protein
MLAQAEADNRSRSKKLKTLEATPLVVLPTAKRPIACPSEEIVSLYHEKLPMLPRVEVLSDGRKRALAARWRHIVSDPEVAAKPDPRSEGLEWFAWYFDHASKSAFLTGKAKDWRADFDFLVAPAKFVKVVEGHYHRRSA